MLRKTIIATALIFTAASAFGAPKDRAKDGKDTDRARQGGAGISRPAADANLQGLRLDIANEQALTNTDAGLLVQKGANEPAKLGLEGNALDGYNAFLDRISELKSQGLDANAARRQALKERDSNDKDFEEKCGGK